MTEPLPRPHFEPRRTDPCFCNSGKRFKRCCGSLDPNRAPPHGVTIVPGFLDADRCAQWVEFFEQQKREPVQIVDHHRSSPGNIVYRLDPTRVTERVDMAGLRSEVCALLESALSGPVHEFSGRSFSWYIGPQVLRYVSGGYYRKHADSDHFSPDLGKWLKGLDRDISLLVYLNDDYSGGELSFVNFNYRYKPRAGDLLFFPSDFRYLHEAHDVGQGTRYVIVSWAAFSGEPRVQPERPANRIDLD